MYITTVLATLVADSPPAILMIILLRNHIFSICKWKLVSKLVWAASVYNDKMEMN